MHAELATRLQREGGRYLVDETTAMARFIIPWRSEQAAATARLFFENMFAQSVLQVVNGEEEVWMLETGLTTGRKANRTC